MLASSDDAAMMSSLRLAGATALCAAILLSACAKKTDQTTSTSTDTSTSTAAPASAGAASAAPDATATAVGEASVTTAPTAAATTSSSTTASTSGGTSDGGGAYITLPVYPGATDAKDNGSMSISTNTGSIAMKSYTTSDDAKKVADWYKSRLPASFKNAILTSDNKTNATFVNEHTDGDQSVLITTTDGMSTRIQLTTKHGK
jgi:hypothetical protein